MKKEGTYLKADNIEIKPVLLYHFCEEERTRLLLFLRIAVKERMVFTIGLFLIVIALLLYFTSRKPKGYPPGPKWWPIIGCAMEMARLHKETGFLFKTFSVLCEKYGPVLGLKIGTDRIVVLNNYESASSMLKNPDCDGRPTNILYRARTCGKRRGLILVDNQLWIEQRRFILRHLKDIGYGRNSMVEIVENEASKLVEHVEKLIHEGNDNINIKNNINNDDKIYQMIDNERKTFKSNKMDKYSMDRKLNNGNNIHNKNNKLNPKQIIVSIHDAFGVTVLNTLWKMIAGKRFNTDDKTLIYLQNILNKVMEKVNMIGAPFSHFPFLRFIAPKLSGYHSFVEVHQELYSFLDNELNDHKNTFNPNAPRDLIDIYLSTLKSNNCSKTFSESQLLAICLDMFVAGSETTSKTLHFGFLYMVLYPDIQRKAQEEIDNVIGCNRLPTLADRLRMPYINAIVLESLRIFAGQSLNVPHRALKDTYIMGYKIPKDTMMIVNFNGLLMNNSWNDPKEFKPERFIDKNGKISIQDQFLPFGLGRHHCMGEILAKSNVFMIIAALLQRFTFSVVPGEQKPSPLNITDGVTPSIKPYKVLITSRI